MSSLQQTQDGYNNKRKWYHAASKTWIEFRHLNVA